MLIIRDILFEFGDSVLWFVKVLIILYACFYLFCVIRQRYKKASLLFLTLAVIGAALFTGYKMYGFMTISIPFFFVGIVLSLNKQKKGLLISMMLLGLIMISEFMIFNFNLALHNAFNVFAIALLIITFSIKNIELRIPSIMAAMSFDIYLVHNKVLMSLKNNLDVVELLPFIFLTIIATFGFYIFRTKILRIR